VQRALSIALGMAVLVVAVWLTAQSMSKWHPDHVPDAGDAASDAAPVDAGSAVADLAADGSGIDPLLDMPMFPVEARRSDGGVGSRMPDGTPVPPLPDDAPKQVRFGVVLIAYRGAEGASPTARSKAEAQTLARELAEAAKTDFHGAVRRGDDGSADDLGHMQRGILELAPEYILFTLPKGGVSDPVDTPRGYWIARRIE